MNFDKYESLPTTSFGVNMIAGAFAGICEHGFMYPVDSVKTRMQALKPGPGGGGGLKAVFTRMIQQEGAFRPIRGISVVVYGAGPAHALYFSCYEFIKNRLLERTPSQFSHLVYGAAGCVATIIHDGIMNPAEVVKQRLQMYNSPYKEIIKCIRHIYKTEGVFAFYRSYTTQLAMNVPYQCIHLIVYEFGQTLMNPEHTYNPKAHVVSGGVAGAVAAALTTPLDVCKTVLNTQQGGVEVKGMVHAVKVVFKFAGIRGYFRGLSARILFQMPAAAICWSTYEFFKYALHNKSDESFSNPDTDEISATNMISSHAMISRSTTSIFS